MNLEQQVVKYVSGLRVPAVVDEDSRRRATEVVLALKEKRKAVVDYWKEPKEKAFQAHRAITAKEKEMLDLVDNAIGAYDSGIRVYLKEQERKRIELQKKADEEARRKEEAEKKKLEKKIEKAEDAGKDILADNLRQKLEEVNVVPQAVSLTERVLETESGEAFQKKDVEYKIFDQVEFLRYCAINRLTNLWEPRHGEIKKFAKAHLGEEIPGLRIEEVVGVTYKTK